MHNEKHIESLKKIAQNLIGKQIIIEELIYKIGKEGIDNRAQAEINVKSYILSDTSLDINGDTPIEYFFLIKDIYSVEASTDCYIVKETLPNYDRKRKSIITIKK